MSRASRGLCSSCTSSLLHLYVYGLSGPPSGVRNGSKILHKRFAGQPSHQVSRTFTQQRRLRNAIETTEVEAPKHDQVEKTPEQMEAIARHARQTFGESLPKDFLTGQEYSIYERLYGPPVATTTYEELNALVSNKERGANGVEDPPRSVPMIEMADGEWEDVVPDEEDDFVEQDVENVFDYDAEGDLRGPHAEEESLTEEERDLRTRAEAAFAKAVEELNEKVTMAEEKGLVGEEEGAEEALKDEIDEFEEQGTFDKDIIDDVEEPIGHGDSARTHPITTVGRSGTSPSTIQIPKDTMVRPVTEILSNASNKHISEVAQKAFGGPDLPHSTATIKKPNLKQQPLGLEAHQHFMSEMEGNAFMAAVMPGAYASILSILVEVRKRLGSDWLQELMRKPEGPRVLDAGAGGAGVLAWREVLRAEWESGYPTGVSREEHPPHGRSTVVTASDVLRHKSSKLLDDTTFIPRLPDYDPSRDHPSLETNNPQPRKQYDVIIAPYTLWNPKEDYIRKYQIQNFWSLLDPKGGVLILLEKGVSRGFELIAGARENLLRHHISSPESEHLDDPVEAVSENKFGPREKGMIIAPCTNHAKCPMYITAGHSQGRKDFCHFSQRFIRPPYLQQILGAKSQNHEDVQFSYVAFRRGVDQRQDFGFEQGHTATESAFKGFEFEHEEQPNARMGSLQPVSPLTFPRAVLPPIKRHGHVILDLCTPSGKIERWTVPKSFSKQAYRDARKSQWGDLWGLGAKTRVPRNVRVGLNKTKSPDETMHPGPDESAGRLPSADNAEPRKRPKKRTPKPQKMKHKKLIVEE